MEGRRLLDERLAGKLGQRPVDHAGVGVGGEQPRRHLRQDGEEQDDHHRAARRIVAGFARLAACPAARPDGRRRRHGPLTKSEKRAVVLPTKPQQMRNSNRVRIA